MVQAQAYVNTCKMLMERGRTEEAVEVLSKVIVAAPQIAEARTLLGKAIAQLNQEAQQKRAEVRRNALLAAAGALPSSTEARDASGRPINPYEKDLWNVVPEVPSFRQRVDVSPDESRAAGAVRLSELDRLNATIQRAHTVCSFLLPMSQCSRESTTP